LFLTTFFWDGISITSRWKMMLEKDVSSLRGIPQKHACRNALF
jgi:hypothetical protein